MKQTKVLVIAFAAVALFAGLLTFFVKLKPQPMKPEEINAIVRKAAVAGQFYPAEKAAIAEKLSQFLSSSGDFEPPNMVVVPHAGWSYSGAVAGKAFSLLKEADYQRVILLGSAHKAYTDKVVLADSDYWQTPLGQVALDQAVIDQLAAGSANIIKDATVHRDDHVLEVELPFLQFALGDFKLVPILLGQIDQASRQEVVENLSPWLDEQTLLIISSDLSHYPDQATAEKVDKRTVAAISSGKETVFSRELLQLEKEYPQVATFACGAEAIKIGLAIGQAKGWERIENLMVTNSGAVTGQPDRVVGYGALAFWWQAEEKLAKKQQEGLLNRSRKILNAQVRNRPLPEEEAPADFAKKRGVFVTLEKDGQLRGCIGNFLPKNSIWEQVKQMTIAAASQDHRFPPVKPEELDQITIEISVLSPLQKVESLDEIVLGKHGVYLKRGARTGTFLPQVANQADWTKESFLAEICSQKMGLAADCYQDPQTEIYTYTAQVFSENE